MHRMTPKWPWTIKGQMFPTQVLPDHSVTNFNSFCSTPSPLWITGHFEICPKWSLNDLEHYEVKGISYVSYKFLWNSSQISVHSALWTALFELPNDVPENGNKSENRNRRGPMSSMEFSSLLCMSIRITQPSILPPTPPSDSFCICLRPVMISNGFLIYTGGRESGL